MLLGVNGISDFNGLHIRKLDEEVQFYAFDMLVSDGEDIQKLPLTVRKTNLSRLLARRLDGIFLSDFEQGEIGPVNPIPAQWACRFKSSSMLSRCCRVGPKFLGGGEQCRMNTNE